MKSKYLVLGSFVFFMAAALGGCKQKSEQPSPYTEYEKHMTAKDTTAVIELIDVFFNNLEHDNVTDAVAMLYEMNDSDLYAEPQLLDNDKIQRVTSALKMFPYVGHRIDYIKFSEVYANEAKVTAILAEAAEGQPEATTTFYFKFYDYLSNWRMCLMSSENHHQRLIPDEKVDSMQQRFAEEMKAKGQAN